MKDCEYWKVDAGRGVENILPTSLEIPLDSINAIILGHRHFDHTGDIRAFPPSVSLIVGADTAPLPELAKKMDFPLKTLEEREVRYMNRDTDTWVDVGAYKGHDYCGDGSLYILDAPGVCI